LSELRKASTVVAVVTAGSFQSLNEGTENAPLSLGEVTMSVNRIIQGSPSDQVTVFAEGPDKFQEGTTYLLFLRPLRDTGDTFAVTGYLSGMYEAAVLDDTLGEIYGRVDSESPKLPPGLAIAAGQLVKLS
jgi:hypothetical protein